MCIRDRGRFELRDDTDSSYGPIVRATQGHTLVGEVIDDDAMLFVVFVFKLEGDE